MNNYIKKCLICGSEDIENVEFIRDSPITICHNEKEKPNGSISQKISRVKTAFICNNCGHIDFFCETNKNN